MMMHADYESAAAPLCTDARRDERRQSLIQPRVRDRILRRGDPGGFHAAPITRQERIGRIQIRHETLQKPGGGRIMRQPVVHPLPAAQTRQEARAAQNLQVSRDTWAALPHRQGKLGDAEFTLGAKGQQSQSCRLARRSKPSYNVA